jgi:hypothetical protein
MTDSPTEQRVTAPSLFAMAMRAQAASQPDVAERFFAALEAGGHFVEAAVGLFVELTSAGRFDEAEAVLRAGLQRRPGDRVLTLELARHRMREGDFAEGLELMEAREINMSGAIRGRPRLSYPEWRGEPVGSLMVFAEQGFGDQIQCARYLPLLQGRGIRVAFACPPPLMPLFEGLGLELVPLVPGAALPRCDAWAMLHSLPYLFGTRLDSVPPPLALPGGGPGVGIGVVTRGNPRHPNDANRSLPDDLARELLDLPGAISLHPEDTGATDFRHTARIIQGLAQVISVDSAVAHLAGSMGKPCRVLLPFVPDWRWLRERTDSAWYPSVVLYRQPSPGDWSSVIAAVRRDVLAEA